LAGWAHTAAGAAGAAGFDDIAARCVVWRLTGGLFVSGCRYV
jgi:hypothetical protein